jgi:hypothetical protein
LTGMALSSGPSRDMNAVTSFWMPNCRSTQHTNRTGHGLNSAVQLQECSCACRMQGLAPSQTGMTLSCQTRQAIISIVAGLTTTAHGTHHLAGPLLVGQHLVQPHQPLRRSLLVVLVVASSHAQRQQAGELRRKAGLNLRYT